MRPEATWAAPQDEAVNRATATIVEEPGPEDDTASDTHRVVAGTLRAPWRWEKLLVETAVIGRDAERWRRRLDGKARELVRQKKEALLDEGGGEARLEAITRVLEQLEHLRAFALPIIETLSAWPREAFITAPTRGPTAARLPASTLAATSGIAAMAASTAAARASSSDTTASPRADTTSSDDPSPATMPSITCRASLSLSVPAPTSS